jgi:hypothetical protein
MGHYQEHLNSIFSTIKTHSPTVILPFSKPIPAQTLSPIRGVNMNGINQVHVIHDLLVWYEIFELSQNGE